jgi:hypothetical protein
LHRGESPFPQTFSRETSRSRCDASSFN